MAQRWQVVVDSRSIIKVSRIKQKPLPTTMWEGATSQHHWILVGWGWVRLIRVRRCLIGGIRRWVGVDWVWRNRWANINEWVGRARNLLAWLLGCGRASRRRVAKSR